MFFSDNMDYCFLKGFLVVLLIQHCTSEGLSTSIQPSTMVTLQDNPALPKETEVPPADMVPAVAPLSLKEVQQVVDKASEQVEGLGVEQVLKELLERVVEAALGHVKGGGEVKGDEEAVQEVVKEGAENEEAEVGTEKEVLEQAVKEEEGEDTGVGEEQELEVDAFEHVAKEEKGAVRMEGKTAAGSMEEITVSVDKVEVIDKSLDRDIRQEIVKEMAATLEETGGDLAVQEDNKQQAVLSENKGAAERETQEAGEAPALVEVPLGRQPEQETEESDPDLVAVDVAQTGDAWSKKESEEKSQADELEGEVIMLPSDNYEPETTQTVSGRLVVEEEEGNIVNHAAGPEEEAKQVHLVVKGGAAEGEESQSTDVREAAGGERDGESEIKKESVGLVIEGGAQEGEEVQVTLETSRRTETEDQAPQPENGADAPTEQSPENQAHTSSSSPLGGVMTGENTPGNEKSNHGNEIITPTVDLVPHQPAVARPTLDNFVMDVLVVRAQAEGEEPGETRELVEDTAETTETSEPGLEAWKIGAISAAVFLVLATAVIIIYILKCRNKNGTTALRRTCEQRCVDPEAATGGDCGDDTLPAVNGHTQQITALDPPDVALTLPHTQQQDAVAMSDLSPSSTEESANTRPRPDSSQDLRTFVL